MGRRSKELEPQLRGRILALREEGMSIQRIATKHELAYSTVRSTIEAAKKRASSQASLPRQGAPRAVTEDQRDAIYEAVTTNLNITFADLQAEAEDASIRTIRRLLREMNIRKWQRKKRPALTEDHA